MTDNQDSVTVGAVQPPTDRPLTAGDGNAPCPGGWLIKDFADGWYWTPHRISAVAAMTEGYAVHHLSRPATSEESKQDGVDTAKLVERLAYGYAIMHTTVCHMAGTSGADGRWYYDKAKEAFGRVSPIHALTEKSNPHVPGDYFSGLSSILAALASPPVSERERELTVRTGNLWWNSEDWETTFDNIEDAYDAATQGSMRGIAALGRATQHDTVFAVRIDIDTTGDGDADDYEIRLFPTREAALTAQPAGEGK